ncbi:hypothetical protein WJ95_13465 [Burkholderia ubonensis]|uniref:NACHT domain-containing protein n=1 Tax=Burkholderia ubonensis TaxID=101571 RepID=UPI00075B3F71|nr:hypothetical protein [Burkholderia ubonensis]KVP88926.1 hypothetical protein WJ95_13465 [Burkholderia ubonensis]
MAVLRTDIERALEELASQEEGMRFQGLAVVLGKRRWPELIARQRKKDFGLDAYAPASLTTENVGKGLAASITPTLKKISGDAKTAKENFPDLKMLLFVTPAKVGNADRRQWEEAIYRDYGLELHLVEREEIITQMLMPENASLRTSFLHLDVNVEPQLADLTERVRRAAGAVTQSWAGKTKGYPLIDLAAVRLDPEGSESAEVMSLEQIDLALLQSRRIVLEGSAGGGKTTTLIQLAQQTRPAGIAFIVELPAWTGSRRGILEYIAGMRSFQAEGLTAADLARVQQTEPILLLLNGWNEIAESNSAQANDALRELERDFPSAGIIVATRTHHLTPPLPGALRLRLLRLGRTQRAAYLAARLGEKSAELRARIERDPSLDELTRTPFVLSEVASLFDAGVDIPSTKIGVLDQVLLLQERRDEHRNALQAAPIYGRQTDYLKALAIEMTRRGAVALSEADARTIISGVVRHLANDGQIGMVGAPAVLATLTAHHVLERVDYPQAAFQFEHQQLQEYHAALDVRARLLELRDDDHEGITRFTVDYVNDPTWAEPLRLIAEALAKQVGAGEASVRSALAGKMLVEMAIGVDLVFAGELVRLCGTLVWNEMRATLGERLRTIYATHGDNFRQFAVAAMLATGADDFSDILIPILSGEDQQARLQTYRLGPDVRASTLGPDWRGLVRGWSEEAREDFVAELLHQRADDEIASFAVEDTSTAVKKAAASVLLWTGSEDALAIVLESMDARTFDDVARENFDRMPEQFRAQTIAAMRSFIDSTEDHAARMTTALGLIELGESGLANVIKDAIVALAADGKSNLRLHHIEPALEYLRNADPAWVNKWVTIQIAEEGLYGSEYWLPFATAIPRDLVEKCLQRLETEDLKGMPFEGMTSVIAAGADAGLAKRVFSKLRELCSKVNTEADHQHEFEWQIIYQLEAIFRRLPADVAAIGVMSSVVDGDILDFQVATRLLSKVARGDEQPLQVADADLRARLRVYLTGSVDLVLSQDDFTGEQKANLASSIAQIGEPDDMAEMIKLIRADIERVRHGIAARIAGDRGPQGNGGAMSYASWHIAAILRLDPVGAEQVLIDLLLEPEYRNDVASAMAREFVSDSGSTFTRTFPFDVMWNARGRASALVDNQRRTRFSAAISAQIERLREQKRSGKEVVGLKELANALAAVDGRNSAATVLDVISSPSAWDQHICLVAIERLMIAGVIVPTRTVFSLLDAFLERAGKWMQDSDRYLLRRILTLCPFVDDPAVGVSKMRDAIDTRQLQGYELREVVTALGESRSESAVDVLYELASDARTFEQCEDNFIGALATLDTPRTRELLLSSIDPDVHGIKLTRPPHHDDLLVAQLAKLARNSSEVAARLMNLCDLDLSDISRDILSRTMHRLGTPQALTTNLNLLDDARPYPIPRGIVKQLETTFIERRPYGQNSNAFTEHARSANELRTHLFKLALEDRKRQKIAVELLGQIEIWRLEHGRPMDEPRHPDVLSGQAWPPSIARGSSLAERDSCTR